MAWTYQSLSLGVSNPETCPENRNAERTFPVGHHMMDPVFDGRELSGESCRENARQRQVQILQTKHLTTKECLVTALQAFTGEKGMNAVYKPWTDREESCCVSRNGASMIRSADSHPVTAETVAQAQEMKPS